MSNIISVRKVCSAKSEGLHKTDLSVYNYVVIETRHTNKLIQSLSTGDAKSLYSAMKIISDINNIPDLDAKLIGISSFSLNSTEGSENIYSLNPEYDSVLKDIDSKLTDESTIGCLFLKFKYGITKCGVFGFYETGLKPIISQYCSPESIFYIAEYNDILYLKVESYPDVSLKDLKI